LYLGGATFKEPYSDVLFYKEWISSTKFSEIPGPSRTKIGDLSEILGSFQKF